MTRQRPSKTPRGRAKPAEPPPREATPSILWPCALVLLALGLIAHTVFVEGLPPIRNTAYKTHYRRGNALRKAKRYDEAIEAYQKTLEVYPEYVDAHVNLGNTLSDKGRPVEAEAAYRRALQCVTKKTKADVIARAHFNLANTLYRTERIAEAKEEYRQATVHRPKYVKAWFYLGRSYERLGETVQAVEAYQAALEIDPDHALSWRAFQQLRPEQPSPN